MTDVDIGALGDSCPTLDSIAGSSDGFDSLLSPSLSNCAVAIDLAERGFAVFPVRDWGDGDGWKPIAGFLQKASASPDYVGKWFTRWPDARVGLLTGERNGISVLDLDLKNGKDGVAALAGLGFSDLSAMSPVRVRTPSGGWHLFFRYDARLKNSVCKIAPGIDVKTTGGFVIAPGSQKGGAIYEPVGLALGAATLPPFPESLIPIAEPPRAPVQPIADATSEQREWAADSLGSRALRIAETGEGGRNSALNDAAMWAAGAAAHGFLTEEQARAALWAACEKAGMRQREFRATFESAWKAGLRKPITEFPRGVTAEDFDDIPDLDAQDSVTARLNRRHAVVAVRGRTLVTTERTDGSIDFGTPRDVHAYYENDRVRAGDGKTEPASRRWMRNRGRRSFPDGVTFAPAGCERSMLNLWRGWAVEPDPNASCARFLDHINTIVCRGNADHAAYLTGWLAHMVQRPGEKPGVGIVLKGGKGAGKDTVADYVARMIGRRHAPTVAESEHIVGKFNARLENALLLHVQEGSWAGDRKAEGVLKYLVTSDRIEIERKGIDSINLPSVLRLFISANADWVVPASPDERRWAVFEISESRRGDIDYFTRLRAEMNGKGPSALMYYLSEYDLYGFNVRAAPETEGLRNQKLASLRNVDLWWFEVLSRGAVPSDFDESRNWQEAPQTVARDALRRNYTDWIKGRRFDGDALDERHFGRRLREMLPSMEDRRPWAKAGAPRIRQYGLPCLSHCRSAFDAWLGNPVDWESAQ
ncbi:bifunctional DNA primase/polymerase [Sphingomonas sp.]|uniref:bifunctional DNA primase/polymerase n=1 Tax=Sphingomonas sp. TaxID=28214 RepID=UPI0037504A5E